MASALKRKRGPGEEVDTPKRAKAVKDVESLLPKPPISQISGWDAAFPIPPPKSKELITANGTNGSGEDFLERSHSPAAIHFDEYEGEEETKSKKREEKTKPIKQAEKAKGERKLLKKVLATTDPSAWKVSDPIGGRQINMDPVFTEDEKFIILATRTTIDVYSTQSSLLHRSIKLTTEVAGHSKSRINSYCLSTLNPSIIWVACSDGSIYCIDWTTGDGADQSWSISSTGCIYMTAASMESAGQRRDIVFTTEVRKDGGWRITANLLARPKDPFETGARTIYTSNQRISFLKTAKEGSVIVAASEKRVLIGSLRSTDYGTIDKIKYEFRVFESANFISSLDLKVSARPDAQKLGKSVLKRLPIVDIVVGDVRGSIFVHDDLIGNLARSVEDKKPPGISLIPRKLHWHRKEVCTVKWSLDGNYVISGGTETVLVLWQLDTGKKQFLPHMSATIQNVVVSPSGTSYGIQLGDNSTMVLSVAELKPTANIAGIQTFVLGEDEVLESQVPRLAEERDERIFMQRTSAVVSPTNTSQLLVGVGQSSNISPSMPLVSGTPYLQTFDLSSSHNISRQALTRTNETNVNITPSAHRVSEPRVTHMKMSFDGQWLATIDEWMPSKRDLDFLDHWGKDINDERRLRQEVYLKFWQWSSDKDAWELVSRIDSPHSLSGQSTGAGKIFDLAADPSSLRFSTIAEDQFIRTWSLKTRKRDGLVLRGKDNQALRSWDCHHAISLGKLELHNDQEITQKHPGNGTVAFSEDGSLIAAAFGSKDLLHFIDPQLGAVRHSKTGLIDGRIIKAEFLGQDLIILSNKIQVYDIVSDEVRHSIKLGPAIKMLSVSQKTEMMHLAVDRKSGTFAIALPGGFEGTKAESLLSKSCELAVFEPDKRHPVLTEVFPNLVTCLLPAAGSGGYLLLDSAAEIRTVHKKGSQAVTTQAQSTSALQLDAVEESNGDLLRLVEGEDEDIEEVMASSQTMEIDEQDEPRVITQQQLTQIFDIGPSFALPPMEDLFYQVAELFIPPQVS